MSLSDTLVVPVDVRAFYVGPDDTSRVGTFAGTSLDFRPLRQTGSQSTPPIVSPDNGTWRPIAEGPLEPLGRGMHVHWNLPRALTHGQFDQSDGPTAGDIAFPLVPNRWLVTRLVAGHDPFTRSRSWVVESDHVTTDEPERYSVTIFTGYRDGDQPFRYLGRVVDADGWSEPETGDSALKTLTGGDLTAMQTGDPIFASFYPDCRNVFGLYDDLEGNPASFDGAQLLYVVAGWYSKPGNDPLYRGCDAAVLLDRLKWRVPDGTTTSFASSLYVGTVQTVRWTSGSQMPTAAPELDVDIAIGNNGSEAMAAMIASHVDDDAHRDILEDLLSAFQIGAVSDLHEPQPDRMPDMVDRLQAAGFGHVESGTTWTLARKTDNTATQLQDLPTHLATLLAALNTSQSAYDAKAREVETLRRQLYLDWYRFQLLQMASSDGQDTPISPDEIGNYLRDYCELVFNTNDPTAMQSGVVMRELKRRDDALQASIAQVTALATTLGWELKALVAPWFWRPNDPVVVLSGADTEHRLHGDNLDVPVPCRPADRLISSLSVRDGQPISGPGSGHPPPLHTPVPVDVWNEALLLNAAWLAANGAPEAEAGLKAFLDTGAHDIITAHEGLPPVADAIQWWDGANPWLPMFMEWTADYHAAPHYTGEIDAVPRDYITGQFTLDDGGVLTPSVALGGSEAWRLSGRAILTPLAALQLIDALDHAEADADLAADIAAAKTYLTDTPLLYQALSGFHDALLLLVQTPQLSTGNTDPAAVGDTADDYDFMRLIDAYVLNSPRFASHPVSHFVPIRAGYVGIELKVADVFGQTRQARPSGFHCARRLRTGDSETQERAYLPPRFSQPARLTFDFLSAAADEDDSTILASPLCGWLLPNNLDDGLAVYDETGVARGTLYVLDAGVRWISEPGRYSGQSLGGAMAEANRHQIDLVTALNNGTREHLHTVMRCLERAARLITGVIRPDPSLAILIGSPIALVQTVVELELFGLSAVNQRWEALVKDNDVLVEDDYETIAYKRVTNGAQQVQVEVLIGSDERFRDGVLGFFVANESGEYDFSRLYSPAADGGSTSGVVAPRLILTPGTPVRLLMLVDPRARIHVTSGVLPTQALVIPPDLTLPFLDKLSVTFPARPVLATNESFDLPLPSEPEFAWSWLQPEGQQWQTIPLSPTPTQAAARFVPQRIYSGWLKLTHQGGQG
jgi:hypothetical protein